MAPLPPNTIIEVLRLTLMRLEREAKRNPTDLAVIETQRIIIRVLAEFELQNSTAA